MYYSGEILNNRAVVVAIDPTTGDESVRVLTRDVPWGVPGPMALTLSRALLDDYLGHRGPVDGLNLISTLANFHEAVISQPGGWPFTIFEEYLAHMLRYEDADVLYEDDEPDYEPDPY